MEEKILDLLNELVAIIDKLIELEPSREYEWREIRKRTLDIYLAPKNDGLR